MQIFILLYIEAGSYIQEDEEKWEFVILLVLFLCWLVGLTDPSLTVLNGVNEKTELMCTILLGIRRCIPSTSTRRAQDYV